MCRYKPIVGSNWILDCISAMELLPIEPYVVLS